MNRSKIITFQSAKKEFIKYVLVNGLTTFLYMLLYYAFNEYLRIYYLISNLIAYVCSVSIGYFMTATYVFSKRRFLIKKLKGFIIQKILLIFINSILIWLFVEVIMFNKYLSQITGTIGCFLLSYYWNRRLFNSS